MFRKAYEHLSQTAYHCITANSTQNNDNAKIKLYFYAIKPIQVLEVLNPNMRGFPFSKVSIGRDAKIA